MCILLNVVLWANKRLQYRSWIIILFCRFLENKYRRAFVRFLSSIRWSKLQHERKWTTPDGWIELNFTIVGCVVEFPSFVAHLRRYSAFTTLCRPFVRSAFCFDDQERTNRPVRSAHSFRFGPLNLTHDVVIVINHRPGDPPVRPTPTNENVIAECCARSISGGTFDCIRSPVGRISLSRSVNTAGVRGAANSETNRTTTTNLIEFKRPATDVRSIRSIRPPDIRLKTSCINKKPRRYRIADPELSQIRPETQLEGGPKTRLKDAALLLASSFIYTVVEHECDPQLVTFKNHSPFV